MQQLLLVGNPAKRRKHSAKRRTKAPSPAQKRARAAFAAMSRARAGKKRTAKRTTRRTRRASSTALTVRSNPVKRHHRRTSPVKHHRRTRRNPISSVSMRGISATLKTAAVAAAGALGVDVAFGFVASYLPASMQTPVDATGATNYTYFAAKGAAAVGIGMVLKKAIGASKAGAVVQGALTVTMHQLMSKLMAAQAPNLTLGMYPNRLAGLNPGRIAINAGKPGMGLYLGGGTSVRDPVTAASREASVR